MKNLMLTLSFLFILSVAQTFAAGTTSSKQTERTWRYEDQSLAIVGTFLKSNNDKVFIQAANEIITLNIQSLYWSDKQYIQEKEQYYSDESTAYYYSEEEENSDIYPFIACNVLSLLGMGILLIWRMRLGTKVN